MIDRIVGQAVNEVLSPNYEPTFHGSSHGLRPTRSCHTAIAEAKGYLEEGYEWVVDIDLERLFDRVHHERLLARLEKLVKDRRLIAEGQGGHARGCGGDDGRGDTARGPALAVAV